MSRGQSTLGRIKGGGGIEAPPPLLKISFEKFFKGFKINLLVDLGDIVMLRTFYHCS